LSIEQATSLSGGEGQPVGGPVVGNLLQMMIVVVGEMNINAIDIQFKHHSHVE
jgi:hypothetical protein